MSECVRVCTYIEEIFPANLWNFQKIPSGTSSILSSKRICSAEYTCATCDYLRVTSERSISIPCVTRPRCFWLFNMQTATYIESVPYLHGDAMMWTTWYLRARVIAFPSANRYYYFMTTRDDVQCLYYDIDKYVIFYLLTEHANSCSLSDENPSSDFQLPYEKPTANVSIFCLTCKKFFKERKFCP